MKAKKAIFGIPGMILDIDLHKRYETVVWSDYLQRLDPLHDHKTDGKLKIIWLTETTFKEISDEIFIEKP